MDNRTFDFCLCKDLIISEVNKIEKADGFFKWSAEAIDRTEVRIKWEWLDLLLGCGHFFSLGIEDWSKYDDEVKPGDVIAVTARLDQDECCFKEFVRFTGMEFVEETFEDAIRMAFESIACAASRM